MRIYYARIDQLFKDADVAKTMQLLPQARLEKINKIKQENSRRESMAAGLLLEYGLREYGLSGKNVTFLEHKDGKPYILEQPNLHYNLSHSGEYVALVMSDAPVGIDIEKLRQNQMRLARRFFAEEECQLLLQNWSDEAFTRMWTRKESYIKACGYGMRMSLAGFSTVESHVRTNEKMNADMLSDDTVYYVESFSINENYWLSVCQREKGIGEEPEEVNIRDLFLQK